MKHSVSLSLLAGLLFGLLTGVAVAQDDNSNAPAEMGGYNFWGGLTGGYRITDVSSPFDRTSQTLADHIFWEQYNLRNDPVFNLNLFGEKSLGGDGFFDQMFLTASHTGPNSSGMLRVRSLGKYDLRVNYDRSDYFFDRFDSVFSDMRQFDQSRNRISASLLVTPVDVLDVQLRYSGNGRSGNQEVPRTGFFEMPSAPSFWGGYGRANFYLINVPTDDWTNDYSAELTAHLPMTDVSAGAGMRKYSMDREMTPFNTTSVNYRPAEGPNDLGIFGTSTVDEPLSNYLWRDTSESTTNYYYGQVVFKPIKMLSATARVEADQLSGTIGVDATQAGITRLNNSGSQLRPYRASLMGDGDNSLDRLTAGLSVAVMPIDGLQILGSYQLRNSKQTSTANYYATIDTAVTDAASAFMKAAADSVQHLPTETTYDIPQQEVVGRVLYSPMSELSLHGGVRYTATTPEAHRTVEETEDSVFNANLSKKTTFVSETFGAMYHPIEQLRVRADFENRTGTSTLFDSDVSTEFTPRRVPEQQLSFRGSVDVDPIEDLTLSLSGQTSHGTSDLALITALDSKLDQTTSSFSGTAAYRIDADTKTMVSLTANYAESDFSIPSQFTRGTAVGESRLDAADSLTVLIKQNVIDRYIGLNASTEPVTDLTIAAGFNYVRSTGGSSMTQSTPSDPNADVEKLNGPFTRWELSGQVQYYFIRNLGASVGGRLVSMEEDQSGSYVALNNFDANMLTFSLLFRL